MSKLMVKYGIRTGFPRLVARGTVRIHTRPRHPRARIGPALSLSGSFLRRAAGYCVFSRHGQCSFAHPAAFLFYAIGLSNISSTQAIENKRLSKNSQLGRFRHRMFISLLDNELLFSTRKTCISLAEFIDILIKFPKILLIEKDI